MSLNAAKRIPFASKVLLAQALKSLETPHPVDESLLREL